MTVPFWLCIPFAGLLASVALCPVFCPEWWEKHETAGVAFFAVLYLLLAALREGPSAALSTAAECIFNDYLTFIVLLFGLFCVSGNIAFEGDLAGSPGVNVALLSMGTLLSGFIGTTGSSMLMVRPVIKMNSWRARKSHIMVFFIFLVSNIGGCLTPLGDPPLLMGFMRGVPFFWSLRLFPVLLVNAIVLLIVFYHLDKAAYRKDVARGLRPDIRKPGTMLRLSGVHNFLFLAVIVAAVLLSGWLPSLPAFKEARGIAAGIPLPGGGVFPWPSFLEVVLILAASKLSFDTTGEDIRTKNHFTWSSIREVAVLFLGIFLTMQPALAILKDAGGSLGLTAPAQMFWATGLLSSFLDNTPTYLVFLTAAGAMGFSGGISTTAGVVPALMLQAISCGAVFMGAMTYIGNAPNFMVKSISDENGIRMPSFFGYLKWSVLCLFPVFLLDTLLFFR